ncbi:hypothetical protein FHX44_114786 [Pseudonocardia hierapolitana]|uniref:Uncharacterized protein n=1 Tax=Pseudonocardia hierapolitana TaxID=1128676 RepID=A0A561SVH6_9PSEU|nr:hypothetical protein FHX44_114786 [Pseudonocardia hierapolitana]
MDGHVDAMGLRRATSTYGVDLIMQSRRGGIEFGIARPGMARK